VWAPEWWYGALVHGLRWWWVLQRCEQPGMLSMQGREAG
jgi:hypothetical protein